MNGYSVEPPGYPGAGRILQSEQLSPVEYLGVSQTPEIPSQSLSITELDGLELGIPAYQHYLREVLGVTGSFVPWQTNSWFLDLGLLKIDGHEFRITYAIRQPPRGAAADIKKLGSSAISILLMPKGVEESTGINEVLLDKALPDRQRVVRDIIAASNLTGKVSALLTAPPKARLVVDNRLEKIWFDGIEITDLKPDTQAFRFVTILAKKFPAKVNKHDLSSQLSASRADGDQTARSAKMTAKKIIRTALEENGLNFEDPFKSENGFYRLIIPAYAP